MNNYPDGAANDPNAPWNQKDPVMIDCPECEGSGEIIDDDGNHDCTCCNGDGEIEVENEN